MSEDELRNLIADIERWHAVVWDAQHNSLLDIAPQMAWWIDKLRDSLPMQQARMEVR